MCLPPWRCQSCHLLVTFNIKWGMRSTREPRNGMGRSACMCAEEAKTMGSLAVALRCHFDCESFAAIYGSCDGMGVSACACAGRQRQWTRWRWSATCRCPG